MVIVTLVMAFQTGEVERCAYNSSLADLQQARHKLAHRLKIIHRARMLRLIEISQNPELHMRNDTNYITHFCIYGTEIYRRFNLGNFNGFFRRLTFDVKLLSRIQLF